MKYTPEMKMFISNNVSGKTTRALTLLFNETFGTNLSEKTMKSYKQNHKLKSGTPGGIKKGEPSKKYSREVVAFIRANHKGIGPKEMTAVLNATFGTTYTKQQIKAYYANHKLNSGLTGRYEKGHVPSNKGKKGFCSPGCEKGWFAEGHQPHNKTDIGTIHKRSDGYLWEKYGPGPLDWKPHHQLVWERAYGPQPEGHVIIFKDSDKLNCDLENLTCVTMAESLELTRSKLRSTCAEHTETGILIVKVKRATRKKKNAK